MDLSTLPEHLREVAYRINSQFAFREGINEMRSREAEFQGNDYERTLTATLLGIALQPAARAELEGAMDRHWERCVQKNMGMASSVKDCVIVGAGYHAAVVAAVRARKGLSKPLVLERAKKPGGAFACSERASFFTNSRNRPGPAEAPGEDGGLNVIPGALVQPSMLSTAEFQTNADIAFAVRLALAMYADVACEKEVRSFDFNTQRQVGITMRFPNGETRRIRTKLLIDATGLGQELGPPFVDPRIMTFSQFMARMDERFPLRGLGRVAVVGGGDSGKCAIESLFGLGPAGHWSVPDLDRIEEVDWYCNLPFSCEEFRNSQRNRYKAIAALLVRDGATYGARKRLWIRRSPTGAGVVNPRPVWDGVVIGGKRYDHVIFCAGYGEGAPWRGQFRDVLTVNGCNVAARFSRLPAYAVGPAARLPYTPDEEQFPWARLAENRVAAWRLAPLTAMAAAA